MSDIDTIKIIEKIVEFPSDEDNFEVPLTGFMGYKWNLEFLKLRNGFWYVKIPTIAEARGQAFVQLISCKTSKIKNIDISNSTSILPEEKDSEFWNGNRLKFRIKIQINSHFEYSYFYFNLNDSFPDNDYYHPQTTLFHAPMLFDLKVIEEEDLDCWDLSIFLKTFGKGREETELDNNDDDDMSDLSISIEGSRHYFILEMAKKYKVYTATRQMEDLLIRYFYTHLYLKKSRKVDKLAKIGEEFQLRRLNVHLKRARLLVDSDVTTSSESSCSIELPLKCRAYCLPGLSSESSSESVASEEVQNRFFCF